MCQLLRAKAKKPQLYYIIQIMRESHRHHSLIRLIVKIDGFFMFSSELILKYESSHSVIAIAVVCCACERASERARACFFVLHLNCYAGFFLFLSRIVLIALSLALLCVLCNMRFDPNTQFIQFGFVFFCSDFRIAAGTNLFLWVVAIFCVKFFLATHANQFQFVRLKLAHIIRCKCK